VRGPWMGRTIPLSPPVIERCDGLEAGAAAEI
jgi:hypothetical protein